MKLKPDKLFERYTTLLHSKNSAVDVDPKFCPATESNRFAVGKPVSVPVSNHTERILKIVFTASSLSAKGVVVEEKPASLFLVALWKALNSILPPV